MTQLFFLICCLAWLCNEIWIFARELGQIKKGHDQGTRSQVAAGVILGLCVAVLFSLFQFGELPLSFDEKQQIGGALLLFGVFLRWWSVMTLGKFFRTVIMVQTGHKVIQSGPYRFIRHPSYTGVLLSTGGFALGIGNMLSLFFAVLIIFVSMRKRMEIEEQELLKKLGTEYKNYMKKTKRLIPFIY